MVSKRRTFTTLCVKKENSLFINVLLSSLQDRGVRCVSVRRQSKTMNKNLATALHVTLETLALQMKTAL